MRTKQLSLMGKRISLLMAVSILLSVSACSAAENLVTPTISPIIAPTEPAVIPTSTQPPQPTTVLPTATSTPEMTSWANGACWDKSFLEDVDTNIAGSLFYQDFQSNEYRLLNLAAKTTKRTNLFGDFFTQIQVSPYGQYYSILRTENNELLLFSKEGEKIFSVPAKTYFVEYLNNSQILLGRHVADDQLYMLNPESGELSIRHIFKPNFPELECYFEGLRCNYRYTAISPDIKYVFYIANGGTNNLLDITSGKLIENRSGGYSFGQALRFPDDPVWKLDGSAVTIFDLHNYYNIGIDGAFTQLTHLENLLSDYALMEGKWSPTGRYLAFITYLGGNVSLFIFDSYTNTLINPCLSENFDGHRHYWPIFWSPVSDVLALDIGGKAHFVNDPPGSDGYQAIIDEWPGTFVVDLAHQSIYQIPNTLRDEQQELLGWLSWELP